MEEVDLSRRNYNPVGQCIYCGSDGGPAGLRREHIIPFSLKGTTTLPQASCKACEKITHAFEHTCARTIFGPLRLQHDYPTRHKHERPTHFDIAIESSGQSEQRKILIDDCPAHPILLPLFGPPGILQGRNQNDPFSDIKIAALTAPLPDDRERMENITTNGGEAVKFTIKLEIVPLLQLLAKIAYAFAIGECGVGSFKPLLPDLILGRVNHYAFLIGGAPGATGEIPPVEIDPDHCLTLGLGDVEGRQLFGVLVHLFHRFDFPIYWVVVGEPRADLVQRLEERALRADSQPQQPTAT